ncbi:DUF748 domain-containing protein [Flavobacterium algicola]|uniref:DUF748 domain-containing protein n=1 Tax=Flavobacterium algicola TaxID=556529 RepID=UPI001EFCBE8F|nr:DUF748 domain-containing protein [Flavobacterium algicola]MCG9790858.1 DUF748 domain-containing protein [Flavobacterium algicola]
MAVSHSKKIYRKKRYAIPIALVVLLIAFRLYLPTLVKNQINKTLANIPGYYGQVQEIDIALYRGAYVIKGLYLNKVSAKTQVPFLNFPQSDISIEWKSIFKGKIVSEIIMNNPEVIYIFEDQKQSSKDAGVDDWTKALTDIIPININHFEIHSGKLAFVQLQADPNIDLQVTNFEMTADNLRNVVENGKTLPSPFHATGTSFGNGQLALDGNINLIKEIPDMDLSFSLKSSDATALNDLTNHYVGIDFEKGKFELYSEIAIADGYLKGYLKPLLTKTKLIGKEDSILEKMWEGFIGFFKFVLKNQKTDTLALKIPIEGDLKNVKTSTWSTVFSIFENGWVQAFKRETDDEITFKDAYSNANPTTKKEIRKQKRQERREERKEAKEK